MTSHRQGMGSYEEMRRTQGKLSKVVDIGKLGAKRALNKDKDLTGNGGGVL